MPERETIERAQQAKRQGKRPTTQAGEFVREEIHHIREGKHGARSAKQAIAIGLSKARRAGVKLGAPPRGSARSKARRRAHRAQPAGEARHPLRRRSRAAAEALRREGRAAASRPALARQGRQAARRRGSTARKAAARKAMATKGSAGRKAAARKAAATRNVA
jgi:Family of unknown function (DUF6496)